MQALALTEGAEGLPLVERERTESELLARGRYTCDTTGQREILRKNELCLKEKDPALCLSPANSSVLKDRLGVKAVTLLPY